MIDHIHINVRDFDSSRAFYVQALKPLGVEVMMEFGQTAGMGNAGKPDLWISQRGEPSGPSHIAIGAPDRATVDAFYEAAIAAGGETTALPARALSTTRTTTACSSWTRTGTTSKPSATGRPVGETPGGRSHPALH